MNPTPEDIEKARAEIAKHRGAYTIIINGYRRQLRRLSALEKKLGMFEKRPHLFRIAN
jgi:hypothetical protein